MFSCQITGFIFVVYICMTLLTEHNCIRVEAVNQIIFYFIYLMQQINSVVRYQPLTNKADMAPYLTASSMQMMVFVCLVVTPCIPYEQFVAPVGTIYSFGYWTMFFMAPEKNVTLKEAAIQYVLYAVLGVFVAYFQQSSIVRMQKRTIEAETMVKLLENHLEGVIVWKSDENEQADMKDPVIVSQEAKKLLKLPDDCNFLETLSEMEFTEGKKKTKTRLTDILEDLNSGQSKDYFYLLEDDKKIPLILSKKLTSNSDKNFIAIEITERKY